MSSEEREQNKLRFEAELEFVQALANPLYLRFLYDAGYFEKPGFLAFLEYLKYWKSPQYVRFIHYPSCLQNLEMVTLDGGRSMASNEGAMYELGISELTFWATWRERLPVVRHGGQKAESTNLRSDPNGDMAENSVA